MLQCMHSCVYTGMGDSGSWEASTSSRTSVFCVQEAPAHGNKNTVNLLPRRNQAPAQQQCSGAACEEQHERRSRVATQLCV